MRLAPQAASATTAVTITPTTSRGVCSRAPISTNVVPSWPLTLSYNPTEPHARIPRSLTHADWTLRSVWLARSTPTQMASSKLLSDIALISLTRATEGMALSSCRIRQIIALPMRALRTRECEFHTVVAAVSRVTVTGHVSQERRWHPRGA